MLAGSHIGAAEHFAGTAPCISDPALHPALINLAYPGHHMMHAMQHGSGPFLNCLSLGRTRFFPAEIGICARFGCCAPPSTQWMLLFVSITKTGQSPFSPLWASSTSSSSFSMTSRTRARLSMNPLTATLNMRFVVAIYLTLRMFSLSWASTPSIAATVERVRRTSGDSSLSTPRARRATVASLLVGKGTSTVLEQGTVSTG